MADYYPLLARALEALPNSSPAMRKAVYDRARNALTAQLRSLDPPVSEADIAVEQTALDSAITRLETDFGSPEPAPAASASPVAPPRASPVKPLPEPPSMPAAEPLKPRAAEPAPAEPPRPAQRVDAPPVGAPAPTPAKAPAQASPVAPATDVPPASRKSAIDAEPTPVMAPSVELAAEPEPKPRTEFVAFVPPPRRKPAAAGATKEPEPISTAPEVDQASSAPSPDLPQSPPIENGAARRPKIDIVAPAASRSRALRNAFVGGVAALVIGAIAVAAFLLRDEPSKLAPDGADGTALPVEQGEQKFGDRVDGQRGEGGTRLPVAPAGPPAVIVAQRGILYEEIASNPQAEPRTTTGRVVWRLEPINGEQGQPLQNVVRMTADFTEAGLTLTLTLRRNTDATLPASHVMELNFAMSGAASSQVVQEIGLIQLKDDPSARGQTVSGLPVRVRDNLFLIGLSNLPSDIDRNRDLLLQRAWLDLAFKFRSGQRGVLAAEKGTAGAQALQSAFDLWRN